MEKLISPGKDPSGQEPKSYVYDGIRIEVSKFFLYEVSLYKYWKNGYCLLGSKLFKSDKFLNIKHPRVYKRFKKYIIEKEISFIAAPQEFIIERDLPVYENIVIKNKPKKVRKNETMC